MAFFFLFLLHYTEITFEYETVCSKRWLFNLIDSVKDEVNWFSIIIWTPENVYSIYHRYFSESHERLSVSNDLLLDPSDAANIAHSIKKTTTLFSERKREEKHNHIVFKQLSRIMSMAFFSLLRRSSFACDPIPMNYGNILALSTNNLSSQISIYLRSFVVGSYDDNVTVHKQHHASAYVWQWRIKKRTLFFWSHHVYQPNRINHGIISKRLRLQLKHRGVHCHEGCWFRKQMINKRTKKKMEN